MRSLFFSSILFVTLLMGARQVQGGEPWRCFGVKSAHSKTKKSTVWAGFGYLNARADEVVYGGPGGAQGNELSHLVWDAEDVLTFNLGFTQELNCKWSVFFDGVIGMTDGNGYMEDYDWLRPTSQWSHRSVHPDTELHHYYQIDVGFDRELIESERLQADVRMGFRYTDIAFDSFGGSFIYSGAGFRDLRGNLPNAPAIAYRQEWPGFYLGPRVAYSVNECLSLRGGAQMGFTFGASGRDHHWLRGLQFDDHFETTMFYGFNLGADYRIAPRALLYVEGTYDKYVLTTADTTISTGPFAFFNTGPGTAGGGLETTQVKAGIKIEGCHKPLFPKGTGCGKPLFAKDKGCDMCIFR